MATFYQRVDLFRRNEDGTFPSTATLQIYDAYNFSLLNGTDNTKDSFTFNLINSNNRYFSGESKIKIGDQIKVFMWKDSASPTEPDDIVFDGIIVRPDQTISTNGKILTIKGISRMDYVFKTIVALNLISKPLPEIITEILKTVLQYQTQGNTGFGFKFVWQDNEYSPDFPNGTPTSRANTITNVKSDGSSFSETYSLSARWDQAITLLKQYSDNSFTVDNGLPYIFWMDNENYIHWTFRDRSTVQSLALEEGTNLTNIKCKWRQDVVNALILNCGIDPNNNGITTYAADFVSITRNGAKWKFISNTSNIGENLMNDDRVNNPGSFDDDTWYPSAYPYTTFWEASVNRSATPVMTKGSTVTVTSNTEYKNAIRTEATALGKAKGKEILALEKDARFQIAAEVPLNNNVLITGLYSHNIPSYNFNNNLRVVELSRSFWNYEPDSEEDEAIKAGEA